MNFTTLKKRLARRLNQNDTSLDTLTNQRLGDFLNEAHREILSEPGMTMLRDAPPITFASVDGQQIYALPTQGVARINRIWETTNDRRLFKATLAWLRDLDPDPASATPTHWIPLSYQQVHTQPSNASEIFAKSTAAGDTTQTIYIEGVITGGYRRTASVLLTGATAVSLSSAITNFIQIDKCYLSAAAVGIVTLHEDSGAGTELSRIAIGDTYGQFFGFLLYPTPNSAITYQVDYTRGIAEMSNDTDEPLLPEDFHDLLLEKAELKELEKRGDMERHQTVQARVGKRTTDLKAWLYMPQDQSMPIESSSNLGGQFPAGRW